MIRIALFLAGLATGILLTSLAFNRYHIEPGWNDVYFLKTDRLTGQSWRLNILKSTQWERVQNSY